jgi:hypothetical protein
MLGGAPQPVWRRWRREEFLLCPCRESNRGRPTRTLVTTVPELPRLPVTTNLPQTNVNPQLSYPSTVTRKYSVAKLHNNAAGSKASEVMRCVKRGNCVTFSILNCDEATDRTTVAYRKGQGHSTTALGAHPTGTGGKAAGACS